MLAQFPSPLKNQALVGLKSRAQPLLFRGAGNCATSPTHPHPKNTPKAVEGRSI
ncbi:hypothetical protein [Streptomyces sp. NPDC012510]|uniref:hypothetical protein n=1 Tax=Streptomyces sp. NPDC012510 TaxID=3364838 RepID=UPI0036EC27BB